MKPIKVHVNRDLSNPIGPNIFVRRLMKYLVDSNKVVQTSQKPDVNFCVINLGHRRKGAKSLLRIDGMYWNGHDRTGLKMNPKIFDSIRRADMVVFQSRFCKRCCERHSGPARKSKIIYNAIDQSAINSIPAAKMGKGLQFVACAKWRQTKRPLSICKGFLESKVNGTLNMIGSASKSYVKDKRIRWMGQLGTEKTLAVMKGCDYAIHLGKFDPCPNVVIEELSCGLPVLHTDNGGAPELIRNDGVQLQVDGGWNYSVLHTEIDNLDPVQVGQGIRDLTEVSKAVVRPDLDIRHAADMYFRAFKELLDG